MKNVAESVKARLQNRARAEGIQLNSLLEEFALARIFARLSESAYADEFILKGAQLFTLPIHVRVKSLMFSKNVFVNRWGSYRRYRRSLITVG